MIKYIALAFYSLLLVGCSSVGNINRTTQHFYNIEIITVNEPLSSNNGCPAYAPLPVTVTPEVPLVKLRQAADKGDHEVIVVLTKYIRDLREYIAKEKKEEMLHQQQYLDSCHAEVK